MNLLGSLIIAFSMYSRIPMPQVSWTKERKDEIRHVLPFPLIGVVIGALTYGSCWCLRCLSWTGWLKYYRSWYL